MDRLRRPAARAGSVARNAWEHEAEVRRLAHAPWGAPAEMDARRARRLARTVARAATGSPFYRAVLGPDAAVPDGLAGLAALPVTSKADIRASGLARAVAPRRGASRGTWGTSGSSGEPFTFEIDGGYAARHAAQRAFVYLQAGLARRSRVVEVLPGTRRDLRVDRSYRTFHRVALGYAGAGLPEAVLAAAPDLLYGNRSHLLQIADWVESAGVDLGLQLVASSSEMLLAPDEARLADVLGAPVIEVYGSAEASNVAFRLAGQPAWRVLEPRVVVEVLDPSHRPVAPGEVGELVVTTLTEAISPLVRYATGDLARVEAGPADGRSGLLLGALEGRSADSLVACDGNRVPFWSIASSLFWASAPVARHVRRWQVHQGADRALHVSLELATSSDVAAVDADIARHLRDVLGDLPVTFRTTPRLHEPRGGKFRAVTSDATAA